MKERNAHPSIWVMPLAEFFATYSPASFSENESWDEAIANMLTSPADRATIEALRADLQRDGSFKEPIRVYHEDGSCSVSNGMHRLAALREEGHSVVTVTTESTIGAIPVIEVEFSYVREDGSAPHVDDVGILFDWLRSFRLGDTWVTTDVMGSRDGVAYGDWYCPLELLPDLVDTLKARALQYGGLSISIIRAEHYPDFGVLTDEEEAEFQRILRDAEAEEAAAGGGEGSSTSDSSF